jgi:hypothetical protein
MLRDANTIVFDRVSVERNLRVTAGGDVLQDVAQGRFITVGGATELIAAGVVNLPGANIFAGGVQAQARTVTIRGDMKSDAAAAEAAAAAAAAAGAGSTAGGLPAVLNSGASALAGGAESVSAAGGGGQEGSGGRSTPGIQTELRQVPQVTQPGVVAVSLPPEVATAGAGFIFVLPGEVMEQVNSEVRVTLVDGTPLPGWLRFVPATGEFVANAVPDGAFPIQVSLAAGGRQWLVVVSERQGQ